MKIKDKIFFSFSSIEYMNDETARFRLLKINKIYL